MCDSTDLSELSREELYSMINKQKEKICLLETQLNQNKNESKKCQSIKRQKSSGSEALDRQIVNKKSFSDRICDDLCEEILQYLSLEDKLKLEGVSKQFQRTVLKSHYELSIKNKEEDKYVLNENYFFNLESLEVLLKKCPNITSIELKASKKCDYNPVFRLIIKYCNNLREIDFGGNEIYMKHIEEFERKFHRKIKSLSHFKDENIYNLFPNIEKLKFVDYNGLQEVIPRLKLNKLTKLELNLRSEEQHLVKTCVDTFPTLTHLVLQNRCYSQIDTCKSLEFIQNLENLIDFSFEGYIENNNIFCDSLKRMANKCQKLKSFDFKLIMSKKSDVRQILYSIKAFPALKRLDLRLYADFYGFIFDHTFKDIFSFEAFKGLSNITHLTLDFDSVILKQSILKDIDINLPNLQYLVIGNIFTLNLKEITEMADILSRLSRLQTLKLRVMSRYGNNKIRVIFHENCKKLRTFKVNHRLL